jgi:hypothetical protein
MEQDKIIAWEAMIGDRHPIQYSIHRFLNHSLSNIKNHHNLIGMHPDTKLSDNHTVTFPKP